MVCLDGELRVTVWNAAMAELTGWNSREVVGLDFVDEIVAPEARSAVRRRVMAVLSQAQGSAVVTVEISMLTRHNGGVGRREVGAVCGGGKDSSTQSMGTAPTVPGTNSRGAGVTEISLLCNLAPRVDGSGTSHGITVLAQDITERVRLEQARKNFVSSFSHELRTPLAGVMGMLELLSGQPGVSHEAQRLIRKGQISANLLLNLVNDILDMSRIEAGKMELAERPFRIKRAVLQTIDLVKYQAEMKGLKVTVSWKGEVPPVVLGDVMRFRQVLLNLLSNAVKFTMRGTIAVRVSCDFAEEATAGSAGGVKLRVRVKDTGIGIKAASLPALFSMFSKVGAVACLPMLLQQLSLSSLSGINDPQHLNTLTPPCFLSFGKGGHGQRSREQRVWMWPWSRNFEPPRATYGRRDFCVE